MTLLHHLDRVQNKPPCRAVPLSRLPTSPHVEGTPVVANKPPCRLPTLVSPRVDKVLPWSKQGGFGLVLSPQCKLYYTRCYMMLLLLLCMCIYTYTHICFCVDALYHWVAPLVHHWVYHWVFHACKRSAMHICIHGMCADVYPYRYHGRHTLGVPLAHVCVYIQMINKQDMCHI